MSEESNLRVFYDPCQWLLKQRTEVIAVPRYTCFPNWSREEGCQHSKAVGNRFMASV